LRAVYNAFGARRAAESLGRKYHLVPVAQMEEILKGLEQKDYDAANRRHNDHAGQTRASSMENCLGVRRSDRLRRL
jgi:hypothetical protein